MKFSKPRRLRPPRFRADWFLDWGDMSVSPSPFYSEYHGHRIAHLEGVLAHACPPEKRRIFLAGDSSLDNKYWLLSDELHPAANGMERYLSPPRSVADVAHHLNAQCASRQLPYFALNCAVEESALCERRGGALLAQDRFLASRVQAGDVVVVSCGGNDVVLKPSLSLILNLATVLVCASQAAVEAGTAAGMGHFINLFKTQYEDYIRRLCGGRGGITVIACMVYYPQEALPGVSSWADFSLGLLGYNRRPETLQRLMQAVFRQAVSRITVEGCRVIPLALYDVLDSRSPTDYTERVEPSGSGGAKMARAFLEALGNERSSPPEGL